MCWSDTNMKLSQSTMKKLKIWKYNITPILGDGLSNNCSSEDTVQLSTDINSLQCKVKECVTTLKGDIKIDNDKIQVLHGKYNLDTQNLTDKIAVYNVMFWKMVLNFRFKQDNNMVDAISTKIYQQVYDDDKRKTAENIAERYC
ncbi:3910_t:CDS:2 [Entrophospora sp. SA101]|nr:3910_t:CDS:2 [Entrophospora sp. SA101]